MARHIRDARLESRTARLKLKPEKIHRHGLGGKLDLGYQRGRGAGRWIARRYLGDERYTTKMIGETDDLADANGDTVLSFNQAQDKARAWASDLDKAERIAALGPVITVRGAVNDYLNERATARDALGKLKHILNDASLAETPMAALTVADLQTWRAGLLGKKMTEASARRVVNDARACLNAAAKRHRDKLPATMRDMIRDGFAVTRGVQIDNSREKQLLSEADIRRLIDAAWAIDRKHGWDGDLARMIIVLAATGARFSQVMRLKVADLQIEQARLMMPTSRKGSGSKAVKTPVPIGPDVLAVLERGARGRLGSDFLLVRPRWRRVPGLGPGPGFGVLEIYERGPWHGAANLTRPWKLVIARAGLAENTIPYALRHSSIVRLLGKGLPVQMVARLHNSSSTMLERFYTTYITSALEDLARAAIVPLTPAEVTPLRSVGG